MCLIERGKIDYFNKWTKEELDVEVKYWMTLNI